MSFIPLHDIATTPGNASAIVELDNGQTITAPSTVATIISEQRAQAGLPNVMIAKSPTATASRSHGASHLKDRRPQGTRGHAASIEFDLGCATGFLRLSESYNVGLDVHTGYKNWNWADGIPDWVKWRAYGSNITFNRGWEKLWEEAELDQESWEGNHLAAKGGGNYRAVIAPYETYILSDAGACVLERSIQENGWVGY